MRKLFPLFAVMLLVAGGLIYLLYRPTSLLLFHVIDWAGGLRQVEQWRMAAGGYNPSDFTVYCLPNGLWAAAYVLLIDWVYARHSVATRLAWAAVIPVIGILAELLQLVGIVPGTADILDVLCYAMPYLIYIVYVILNKNLTAYGI